MIAAPIFAATVLGIAASFLDLETHVWPLSLAYEYLNIASATLSVFVAFVIGLMLKPVPYRATAAVIAARYGCDGAMALALVVATLIVSLVLLPATTCLTL